METPPPAFAVGLSTPLLFHEHASMLNQAYYFPKLDLLGSLEMDGKRVTFYNPDTLHLVGTLHKPHSRIKCMVHIPHLR